MALLPAAAAPSLLGAPVALGMSECQVVDRAGAPSAVQIGTNPNGDRTALLTYDAGPRPGIYHFERGHLMVMDRVAVAAPEPKVLKKKPRVVKETGGQRRCAGTYLHAVTAHRRARNGVARSNFR